MRTKEEIIKEALSGMKRVTGNGAEHAIAEALLDIRDILENRLKDLTEIAEPIKHIANNNGSIPLINV